MRLQARAPPYGDANSFSPPLYITRSDIDEIVQRYARAEPRIAGAGATRVVASVLIEKFAGSVMATTIMPAHGMGPGLRACQANDGGGAEEELQRGHACFETRPFGRSSLMALRKPLILRRPRSGRLEGRSALIQPIVDFPTVSCAGLTRIAAGLLDKLSRSGRQ
jgi:hypothetical protein